MLQIDSLLFSFLEEPRRCLPNRWKNPRYPSMLGGLAELIHVLNLAASRLKRR